MTKSAFTNLDRAAENEWSDVLPDAPAPGAYPSATTRTSGLRPAIMQPPPASERLPLPSRIPVLHSADEPTDRTIQRTISIADLDFEDADRTKEIAPDQASRLAATAAALPSDVPPALPQRATMPAPASNVGLPPHAFPSLSDLAGSPHRYAISQPPYVASAPVLRTHARPMPWMATPPLPRDERRLATLLVVLGAFVATAAVVLGTALWILQK